MQRRVMTPSIVLLLVIIGFCSAITLVAQTPEATPGATSVASEVSPCHHARRAK